MSTTPNKQNRNESSNIGRDPTSQNNQIQSPRGQTNKRSQPGEKIASGVTEQTESLSNTLNPKENGVSKKTGPKPENGKEVTAPEVVNGDSNKGTQSPNIPPGSAAPSGVYVPQSPFSYIQRTQSAPAELDKTGLHPANVLQPKQTGYYPKPVSNTNNITPTTPALNAAPTNQLPIPTIVPNVYNHQFIYPHPRGPPYFLVPQVPHQYLGMPNQYPAVVPPLMTGPVPTAAPTMSPSTPVAPLSNTPNPSTPIISRIPIVNPDTKEEITVPHVAKTPSTPAAAAATTPSPASSPAPKPSPGLNTGGSPKVPGIPATGSPLPITSPLVFSPLKVSEPSPAMSSVPVVSSPVAAAPAAETPKRSFALAIVKPPEKVAEEERKKKEAEEQKRKEEEERKKKEEEERKKREEEERIKREKEEAERKKREEEEAAERKRKEEEEAAERKRKEAEAAEERRKKEEAERLQRVKEEEEAAERLQRKLHAEEEEQRKRQQRDRDELLSSTASEGKEELLDGDDGNSSVAEDELRYVAYANATMWRPDQASGQRVYPKDFLLQFRDWCTDRPGDNEAGTTAFAAAVFQELANAANLAGNDWKYSSTGSNPSPRVGRNGQAGKRGAPPGMGGARGGSGGGGGRGGKRGGADAASGANRWDQAKASRTKQLTREEAVLRKATSLLNKLAEDNFDSIVQKLLDVGIDSADILSKIIGLIFDKAILEPKFCEMYANLCVVMSKKCPDFTEGAKKGSFKFLLLSRVQERFEANFPARNSQLGIQREENKKTKLASIEKMTREERAQFEEDEMLAKKRMFGNVTFVGQLYCAAMLNTGIMGDCINTLIGDAAHPSEDYLEALCKLLTIIGLKYETRLRSDAAKANAATTPIDQTLATMQDLTKHPNLSSRIHFMLIDLLDLQANKWANRHAKPAAANNASTNNNSAATQKHTAPAKSTAPAATKTILSRTAETEKEDTRSPTPPIVLRPQVSTWKHGKEPAVPSGKQEVSNSEIQAKAESILEEYFTLEDAKEVIESIKDLQEKGFPNTLSEIMISTALRLSFTKKEKDRENIRQLFTVFAQNNVTTEDAFYKGFKAVTPDLEDISEDIPNVGSYFTSFLVAAINTGYLSPESITEKGLLKTLSATADKHLAETTIVQHVAQQLLEGSAKNKLVAFRPM